MINRLDDEPDDQELEAHYMYMAKIQAVLQAANDNIGPIYDTTLLEKIHLDDDYNMYANENEHTKQPESINDTYVVEKVDNCITPDSSDMCIYE
ncbi:hypothetical protein Tco_0768492 [Tanacetum coccineum]